MTDQPDLTPQEAHDDFSMSLYFLGACMRAEIDAGRKLTPAEMIEAIDKAHANG